MTGDYEYIAWLDLETTGLSPERDELLELAIIVTNLELEPLAERSWLIMPHSLDPMRIDPFVWRMHTENELLAELLTAHQTRLDEFPAYEAKEPATVDWQAHQWLREVTRLARGDKLGLAGSGVSHFDVRWLAIHLPQLAYLFHRSTIDVGVMRRFFALVDAPDLCDYTGRDLVHRGLEDAWDHLAEARYYRDVLRAGQGSDQ